MPTVAELMRWAGPVELRLMAGASGLAREVTRIVRFRSARRDVQLQPGDLVLLDVIEWGSVFGPVAGDMLDTIGTLKVAGVLVSGQRFETAVWRSGSWSTPIILAPEIQLDFAETLLTTWLLHTHAREDQQANELRGEMLRAEYRLDMHDLVQRAVQFTNKPVFLHGADGSVVLVCQPAGRMQRRREIEMAGREATALLKRVIRQKQVPIVGVEYQELASSGYAMLAAPVREAAKTSHYLSLIGRPAEFAHRDRIVLLATSDASAMLQDCRETDAAEEMARVLDGERLPDLVRLLSLGRVQEACGIAASTACNLDQAWMGLAFATERGAADLRRQFPSIANLVRDHQPLIRLEAGCILCLLPATTDITNQWQRRETVQHWQAQVSAIEPTMRIGYSAVHARALGAHRALVEARHALALGLRQDTQTRAFGYAATCLRELTMAGQENPLLQQLYELLVWPLIVNDHPLEQDLQRTLIVHLEAGCRTTQTAEVLGVHRNTVLYRLARIVELTGVDLEDSDTRLLLHLLLRSVDDRHPEFGRETVDLPLTVIGPAASSINVVWLRPDPGSSGLVLETEAAVSS